MKKNSKVVKEIIDKYGSYTLQNIDVNLYSALSKFELLKLTSDKFSYDSSAISLSSKPSNHFS